MMNGWSEPSVRSFLAEHGLPCGDYRFARSSEEAVKAAEAIGYPVVMKVVSAQITHKSDVGGVRLNLGNASLVEEAYRDIVASCTESSGDVVIDGVIVTPMHGQGVDVIVGLTRDPQFGPVVMVGLGGILVELFSDVSFRVAPISPGDALAMLSELKGYNLLQGYRGSAPCDKKALADTVSTVSHLPFLVRDMSVVELDLNPVRVFGEGEGVAILDVRMRCDQIVDKVGENRLKRQ